jgi:arsenite-transporting ATPase
MYGYLEKLKDAVKFKASKRSLLEIIGSWETLSERIVAFIRNEEITKYLIVTIPEALGVRLTERIITEFNANMLKVENIVINYVVKEADCDFHRTRKAMQEHYMDFLRDTYRETNIVTLYLSPYEVKGLERISAVAGSLFSNP